MRSGRELETRPTPKWTLVFRPVIECASWTWLRLCRIRVVVVRKAQCEVLSLERLGGKMNEP